MSGRYEKCDPLTHRTRDGAEVAYLAARILPLGASVASGASTTVRADERHRLDLVAYRTLRDPEAAWRIADANDAMDPFELCRRPGQPLRLPASPT